MSYIGNTPTQQNFVAGADQFSGNGSTVAFTLSRSVNTVFDIFVTVANVPQDPFTAYTVSGNTLTFDGAPPSGTNNIDVVYRATNVQTFVPSPGVSTQLGLGSASAPSLTFIGDTNTGIYSPAADTVAIGTGGTERLRVDSAGNAGLGVTPSAWGASWKALQLNARASIACTNSAYIISNSYNDGSNNKYIATGAAAMYEVGSDGAFYWNRASSGTAGNAITFTQAMTLDASGNLLVGGTSSVYTNAGRGVIEANGSSQALLGLTIAGNSRGYLYHDGTNLLLQQVINGALLFSTNNTERARITSGGNFLIGKTTAGNVDADGVDFGAAGDGYGSFCRPAATPLFVARNTNDGTLVSLRQGGVEEGTISVSGTTVSYNGGHLARWSQLLNGQRDESILKGTVLSNLDEMCEWIDAEGNPLPNEQLNRMKVSDVEGDTNVAGVFVNWDNDDQDNPYDMNIAMTGDMIIRIAQGVTVQKGDLLMSAGDGTAKPQGDDIVRSKTVAKVTSNHVTCTYDDGSYCVPCVLMAC